MKKFIGYLYVVFFSLFPRVFQNKILRKYFTKNYSSGMLAIGETLNRWKAIGPEWIFSNILNSDINIELEENTRLPFNNQSINLIFSAHMIEHLTLNELENFVSECARILKNGGAVRFEAPDAEAIIDSYNRKGRLYHKFYRDVRDNLILTRKFDERYNEEYIGTLGVLRGWVEPSSETVIGGCAPIYAPKELFEDYINRPLKELDNWLDTLQTPKQRKSHGHNTLIYFDKLKDMFNKHGNFDCYHATFGESNIPGFVLNDISKRHKNNIMEGAHRADYSLYFEAIKKS